VRDETLGLIFLLARFHVRQHVRSSGRWCLVQLCTLCEHPVEPLKQWRHPLPPFIYRHAFWCRRTDFWCVSLKCFAFSFPVRCGREPEPGDTHSYPQLHRRLRSRLLCGDTIPCQSGPFLRSGSVWLWKGMLFVFLYFRHLKPFRFAPEIICIRLYIMMF